MQLYATESNPIPKDPFIAVFSGVRDVPIRYALWQPTGKPLKGTVCLFHGRTECIEKYFETITELRARGFAVATMDWRGQGASGRMLPNPRKGFVDSFVDYDRDLARFMQDIVLPDCPAPFYALAHSTGGNILLRAARLHMVWFERMVLVSPLLRLNEGHISQPMIKRLTEVLSLIGLGGQFFPGYGETVTDSLPLAINPLTRDAARLARNAELYAEHPQLSLGGPTIQWVYAACKSMEETADPDFAASVTLPILIFGGTKDKVVAMRPMERLAHELRNGSFIEIPGAYHEILMERDAIRSQFWAGFDAFVPGTPVYGRTRA